MKFPKCFDSIKQYESWKKLIEPSHDPIGLDFNFCTDCTFQYQQQMIQEERCEFPDVLFVSTKEYGIVGVRNSQRTIKNKTSLYKNNIAKLRKEKNLTLVQFSNKIGMFRSSLMRIESGDCKLQKRTEEKISTALGVTIKELYA